ncbi:MAG: WD40-repeat-containing domain protein [Benniella sp.]|nr:MAG: WD40-repeat-containing domain protein [Benniella sp.]
MQQEFRKNFDEFEGQGWTLSSKGANVDRLLAKYIESLSVESALHSFVLESTELAMGLAVNANDKRAIKVACSPTMAMLGATEMSFLRLYDQPPAQVLALLQAGWRQHQPPLPNQGFCDVVVMSLYELHSTYQKHGFSMPYGELEYWYVQRVWGFIARIFEMHEELEFKSTEVSCKASKQRKNETRGLEERLARGRRLDGMVTMANTDLELCAIEAARVDGGHTSTKALKDNRKLAKSMKDMMDRIRRKATTDISQNVVVFGIQIAEGSISMYTLKKLTGRFYKVTCVAEASLPKVWDQQESGESRHILAGHISGVFWVVFSPNGNQVASCSRDTIRIWDSKTGICHHTLIVHIDSVQKVAYSPRGDQVVSSSYDMKVTYSVSGNQIASGGFDGSLKLWDLEARICLWTLIGYSESVNRILYSSRGDLIVTASSDKSVRLWDVASGQCRINIQGFQDGVNAVLWTEDSGLHHLITGCSDGMVGRWKVEMNEDHCPVALHWMIMTDALNMNGVSIQDAQGLSQLNKQLLVQRGVVGEPVNRLREVGKKVATMASVVSKLKTHSVKTEEDPVSASVFLMDQLEQ